VAEAVKLKISERDDIADLLALVPPWFVGAVFWVGISELVLKRLYPDDVGDMPPGVAMVAVMYNTLYLVEVKEGITGAFIDELAKTANKIIITIAKFTGQI